MFKALFVHTVKDEPIVVRLEEISFFGPAPYKPTLKEAEFKTNPDKTREVVKEPVYGPEVEICQIHLSNKTIVNCKYSFTAVVEMCLQFGAMVSFEKNGLKMHVGAGKDGPDAPTKIR